MHKHSPFFEPRTHSWSDLCQRHKRYHQFLCKIKACTAPPIWPLIRDLLCQKVFYIPPASQRQFSYISQGYHLIANFLSFTPLASNASRDSLGSEFLSCPDCLCRKKSQISGISPEISGFRSSKLILLPVRIWRKSRIFCGTFARI